MSTTKPRVIVTRKLPDAVETRMRELFDTQLNIDDTPMTRDQLAAAMADCDVLVPTVSDDIDADLIAGSGDRLRMIANFGNGVDNIDVSAAATKSITVTNTPRVLTDDTADMIMAMMLAVPRRLVEGAQVMARDEAWPGWSPTWMLGRRVTGKRLGIVGMGRIGAAVARRAKAFGLSIHYHNRERAFTQLEDELEATHWESLDQMLARMDFISINCPSTPATYHLLSERRLKLMPQDAIIVNAARGDIIDEEALVTALEEDRLGGAALDVFENEPSVSTRMQKLAQSGKLVMLPHMGSATVEGRNEMGDKVLVNIRTFFDGHRPPDRVLPPRG
ncbi:D-glycerate dehydrogenase [Ahrensia sp. R2A130]|uniref:2-hydroxyacid dehydrogenase n=1 Tax=Ahrensia sp. R2A130 TaxID=744979 RepID=UPI0001E0D820|nr:D-glycerate dehydrogenase [Ahrensia sp. R2A130]EFL89777.1 glyoxylate reductase [Ahrensia sp. R2A130]